MHDGKCAGTASIIAPNVVMTARHCVTEDGKVLDVFAFGQRLKFLAASPKHDMAFFNLSEDSKVPNLRICPAYHQIGSGVCMLAYPQAVDEQVTVLDDIPMISDGKIVKLSPTADLLLGDYAGGVVPAICS